MSGQTETWMPLYVGDYLGDTQRLTTEQHGAYLLLILDYWRNGPAPDDDAILQQITKLDKAGWKKHRTALARLFQIDSSEWKHKRIDAELNNATANAERRTDKAKKGAAARWGKHDASSENAMPKQCSEHAPSMYNVAFWIVAHPKKPMMWGQKPSAPGPYDISGSAHWANKADYGAVIHRPNKETNMVELIICKVRMGLPGREQTFKLEWSWQTSSYAAVENAESEYA